MACVPHVIAEPCIDVKDGACVDVCPVHCIETTADANMFFIDPDRCIDCRICALVCPVEAVFSNYDLPPRWESYEKLNVSFFKK